MKRHIAIIVSAFAALAFTCQVANAGGRHHHHHKISKRVKVVAVGTGVASAVTYWSLLNWNWNKHSSGYKWGAYGAVTLGCVAVAPIVAAVATPERHLTNREVGVLVGNCVVPIVGGWLVNAAYDANPQWEPEHAKSHRRHHRGHHKRHHKM